MEEHLLKKLDQCIKKESLTGRSEAIRQAVRDWLKKKELSINIQKEVEGYKKKPVKAEEFDPLLSLQEIPL